MLSHCIPLQKSVVYGPILSRRLGRSLGVNILSPFQKICSFDCVYCQYGKTTMLTESADAHLFFGLTEIEREVVKALRSKIRIDYVTLSGNGEPTLHPLFCEIVNLLRKLIAQERPSTKLALFSNSTMIQDPKVFSAVKLIDVPILKMDTAFQDEMIRINRPAGTIKITRICDFLSQLNNLSIQTIFLGGHLGNSSVLSINAWIDLLIKIKPKQVFIQSSDFDFLESDYCTLKPRELLEIENYVKSNSGINVKAYWAG